MGKVIKHPGPKKKSPKQNIISNLKLNFPRLERKLDERERIPSEEKTLYGPPIGIRTMRISKTLADEGYIKWSETYVDTFIGRCLDHVLYRCLKLVYGLPDPITLEIMEEEVSEDRKIEMGHPTEWGYLIQGKGGSCFDIIKRYRDDATKIVLWLNTDIRPNELPKEVEKGRQKFMKTFHNLVEIVDREYSIDKEKQFVKDSYINLYHQRFQSGKDVLELSDTIQPELIRLHTELISKGDWDDALAIHRRMVVLYTSAIVYFFMALEGFINLIYKLFLIPKFTDEKFKRPVWKADLDLRILHLPVYCRGFANADITSDSEVYKQCLSIRSFRNDLIHANITKECEIITTGEDGLFFHYSPLSQIKLKDKITFHTDPFRITKDNAINVMKKVELIVSGIIEKMDDEEKVWVKGWIDQVVSGKKKNFDVSNKIIP